MIITFSHNYLTMWDFPCKLLLRNVSSHFSNTESCLTFPSEGTLGFNVLNNIRKEPLFSFYMAVVIHSDGPITCRGIFSAPTAQPWMPMLAWRAFDLPSEVNTKWQDFCLHSLDTFLPSRGLSTHRHGRMTTTKPAKNTSSLVASKLIEQSKII